MLWWSQRDGWAHLYLLGADGETRRQITSGPWVASLVHHVDEDAGQIYFDGRGRDDAENLYYRHLYRVNLDGSGLTDLTPEPGDHTIRWAPEGGHFVAENILVKCPSKYNDASGLNQVPEGTPIETTTLGN